MPFPNPDTQFKPGQSGNPGGYSSPRRIATALLRLIDEKGLDRDIATTLLAKALGDETALRGRKPEWAWFKELLDRIDGPRNANDVAASFGDEQPKRIVIPDVDERLAPRED